MAATPQFGEGIGIPDRVHSSPHGRSVHGIYHHSRPCLRSYRRSEEGEKADHHRSVRIPTSPAPPGHPSHGGVGAD